MPAAALAILGVILLVNIYCRMEAERHRRQSVGAPDALRPWPLRLHSREAYATSTARTFHDAAVGTSLLFMILAVAAMLVSYNAS